MIPRRVRSVVPVLAGAHEYALPAATTHPSGRSVAVLLCHGFGSSPVSVRPWAEALARRGYDVSVPRLPGHGTAWPEMNVSAWTDWYDRLVQEYVLLSAGHDVVMVGGLSMGGGLAIRLTQHHPVPALVVVNPSIATYDARYVWLLPWLRLVKASYPGVSGDIHRPDWQEYPSYGRSPLRAADSMRRMWDDVSARLDRLTVPTLVFRSEVDHVVDDRSVELLRSLPNVTVRMLRDSYHVATLDYDAERIGEESADFFDAHLP